MFPDVLGASSLGTRSGIDPAGGAGGTTVDVLPIIVQPAMSTNAGSTPSRRAPFIP
jgi:hypothetical protein